MQARGLLAVVRRMGSSAARASNARETQKETLAPARRVSMDIPSRRPRGFVNARAPAEPKKREKSMSTPNETLVN